MAYETGTATSPVDLLNKLRVFVAAQGWTINQDAVMGSGRVLCISKGTQFMNFRAAMNESIATASTNVANCYGIQLNGSDAWSNAANPMRNTGFPKDSNWAAGTFDHRNAWSALGAGPFVAYHFFSWDSGANIACELEVSTGIFHRFSWGLLDPIGDLSAKGGGRYFHGHMGPYPRTPANNINMFSNGLYNASYSPELIPFRANASGDTNTDIEGSYVRAVYDSFDGWAVGSAAVPPSTLGRAGAGMGGADVIPFSASASPLNGVALLQPAIVSALRSGLWSPIGAVKYMRMVRIDTYLPGDEISFGPDVWKLFPLYQKGGQLSYNIGIAYKKET